MLKVQVNPFDLGMTWTLIIRYEKRQRHINGVFQGCAPDSRIAMCINVMSSLDEGNRECLPYTVRII